MDTGKRLLELQIFFPNIRDILWPSGFVGNAYAPPDTPICGFDNELCSSNIGKCRYR